MGGWKENAVRERRVQKEKERKLCQKMTRTHNMKSCSQLGRLPLTAMVVLFTFCTFRVT